MIVGHDQAYLNQPWVSARTIRVDSTEVGFLDFKIAQTQVDALYGRGYRAAETFLSYWNWQDYLERYWHSR